MLQSRAGESKAHEKRQRYLGVFASGAVIIASGTITLADDH